MGDAVKGAPRGWLSVAEAAKLTGVHPKTMLRRLMVLNERSERSLLQSFQPAGKRVRKWFVSPEVLFACLRADESQRDTEVSDLQTRIIQVEQRTLALRTGQRVLRRKIENVQRWREGAEQAIFGLSRMLGLPDPTER